MDEEEDAGLLWVRVAGGAAGGFPEGGGVANSSCETVPVDAAGAGLDGGACGAFGGAAVGGGAGGVANGGVCGGAVSGAAVAGGAVGGAAGGGL